MTQSIGNNIANADILVSIFNMQNFFESILKL